MNRELEDLIGLLDLLHEVPQTGYSAMSAAYRKACERYATANGIPMTAVMDFVRKMHRKKLASENKRSGRPPNT